MHERRDSFIPMMQFLTPMANMKVLRRIIDYHVVNSTVEIVIYATGSIWKYDAWSGVFYSDDFYLTERAHSEGSLALPTICSRTTEIIIGGLNGVGILHIRIGGFGKDYVSHYKPSYDGLYSATTHKVDFISDRLGSYALPYCT